MTEKNITLIAALSNNQGIGFKGNLPWPKIPEDMAHFRNLTLGKSVIMGRATFESIGKPLIGRQNIVITSRPVSNPVIFVAKNLPEAINLASNEIYVIGGERVYREAMPLATNLEIARIYHDFEVDRFFPEIDLKIWQPNRWIEHYPRNLNYTFISYKRR